MDSRLLILVLPSAGILALLVFHSWYTLPRPRAAGFWAGIVLYGVLRGVALRAVVERGLEGSLPYAIHRPLFPVFGVPLQEIVGWAIVGYLGWWFGWRFAGRGVPGVRVPLFPQIAWACLLLGAISWVVESAAVSAGWWHWTVPIANRALLGVPFIGLVDWFFVGVDFLLPYLVITAPELRGRPGRFLALLTFPLHFGGHCFVQRIDEAVPIPVYHLVHWLLLGLLFWCAARSRVADPGFTDPEKRSIGLFPLIALGIILADGALVLLVVHRPELLASVLPVVAAALQATRPGSGFILGIAGVLGGLGFPALLLAGVPAAAALGLDLSRRHRRWLPGAALGLAAMVAYGLHAAGARREADLLRRLDRAIAARDEGDLRTARGILEDACRDFPETHVPAFLLGEILYRIGELREARPHFLAAVRAKPDHLPGFRFLAVIDLRLGNREEAARSARSGLDIEPEDPELGYLSNRASGRDSAEAWEGPGEPSRETARTLATLAFEVGDQAGATAILDRGLARWPEDPWFCRARVNLALEAGDEQEARRVAAFCLERFPEDPEARELARRLRIE